MRMVMTLYIRSIPAEKSRMKLRVLIADDDKTLVRRLGDHLEQHGFETLTCGTGSAARAIIAEYKPKFVVSDLMLPDGGAMGLIDFIKQEPQLKTQVIHIIVTSG